MERNSSSALLILIVAMFLVGCQKPPEPLLTAMDEDYSLISMIDYDSSLCTNTGYGDSSPGFRQGVRVMLKDKDTGNLLEGDATISTGYSTSSVGRDSYSCEEGADSHEMLVMAYAAGHAPSAFILTVPDNRLATIEIPLARSCTGAKSFFDNLKTQASFTDEDTNGSQEKFYALLKEQFGLEKEDLILGCAEADMGRGGFIKAKGTYKGASSIELYYRWGWCSSGGADCGYTLCFASPSDDLLSSVKDISCKKLTSRQYHDGSQCIEEAFDNTLDVQESCLAGMYEEKNTFSVVQNSGRCNTEVSAGTFNCLEN